MGDNLSLSATLREGVGKGAARDARRNNLVPGIIYGGSEEPLSINVKFNDNVIVMFQCFILPL